MGRRAGVCGTWICTRSGPGAVTRAGLEEERSRCREPALSFTSGKLEAGGTGSAGGRGLRMDSGGPEGSRQLPHPVRGNPPDTRVAPRTECSTGRAWLSARV